jgi:hypothetical protein
MYNYDADKILRFKNWFYILESQAFSIGDFLQSNGIKVGQEADVSMSSKGDYIFARNRATGQSISIPVRSNDANAMQSVQQKLLDLFGKQPNPNQQTNQQQVDANQSNQQTNQQQVDANQQLVISDPTNTKFGKFFAAHAVKTIKELEGERGQGVEAYRIWFGKGGYAATMYDDIHTDDAKKANDIRNKIEGDLKRKYNVQNSGDIDIALNNQLTTNLKKVNEWFQYSDSMTKHQPGMMWFRCTKTMPIDDKDSADKQRVYINLNPVFYEESIRWISDIVGDFYVKNPGFVPYVYVKFKIRVQSENVDRADTCIVYINVRSGVKPEIAKGVINSISSSLSKIPQKYISGLSSPLLVPLATGVTTVSDNVRTDPKESYTSQLGASWRTQVLSYANNFPKTQQEFVKVIQDIIQKTVIDLKSRGYPV